MFNKNISITATAYALPETAETVQSIIQREKSRVDLCLRSYSDTEKSDLITSLGIEQVRVCNQNSPYNLARTAFLQILAETKISPGDIDLVVDFSTFPDPDNYFFSIGHQLCSEFEIDNVLNITYKIGGCAGLHMALKTAAAIMNCSDSINTALLVAADSPPSGNRSLLPISIQGDAGSSVLLTKKLEDPHVLATEICTHSFLGDVITLIPSDAGSHGFNININTQKIESELKPIYYLNFYRLIQKIFDQSKLSLNDIHHFVYSNLSRIDQTGFIKALNIPKEKVYCENLSKLGHTFAADLVINYTDLKHAGFIKKNQYVLFASAGIGFTWGVSLVKT